MKKVEIIFEETGLPQCKNEEHVLFQKIREYIKSLHMYSCSLTEEHNRIYEEQRKVEACKEYWEKELDKKMSIHRRIGNY